MLIFQLLLMNLCTFSIFLMTDIIVDVLRGIVQYGLIIFFKNYFVDMINYMHDKMEG